jgi:hypothetical protein
MIIVSLIEPDGQEAVSSALEFHRFGKVKVHV